MQRLPRVILFLVLAVFTIQIVEVPPSRTAVNPKTCCGRIICRCTHAPGARCTFQHSHAAHRVTTAPAGSAFSEAPCHQNSPRVTVPGWYRDYEVPEFFLNLEDPSRDFFYHVEMTAPVPVSGPGIDHPPRSF